jgi:hypothetical protein
VVICINYGQFSFLFALVLAGFVLTGSSFSPQVTDVMTLQDETQVKFASEVLLHTDKYEYA